MLIAVLAQDNTIKNEIDHTVHELENRTSEEVDDKLKTFFHDSRNKLYQAFYNLSSYLPLDIHYAETVGKECDILKYNKEYYTAVGLVLSGLLALVGILFAFFGEFMIDGYIQLEIIIITMLSLLYTRPIVNGTIILYWGGLINIIDDTTVHSNAN